MEYASENDVAAAGQLLGALKSALAEVIFGKEELIELLVCGMLACGHILLVGCPG